MDPHLLKLQTTLIDNLCGRWTQNCDGGCQEEIGSKKVLTEGPWTFLWQAKKGFFDQHHCDVALMITNKDHKTMSEAFVREEVQPVLDRVHEEFLRDFDRLVNAHDGRWLTEVATRSIKDILQMDPWTLSSDRKRLRTTQTLRGDDQTISCTAQRFDRKNFESLEDSCRVAVSFACGCGQPQGHDCSLSSMEPLE